MEECTFAHNNTLKKLCYKTGELIGMYHVYWTDYWIGTYSLNFLPQNHKLELSHKTVKFSSIKADTYKEKF